MHRNNQDACDQNHLEVERKTEKRKRGGGGEKEEVIEENLEKEKDEKEKKNKMSRYALFLHSFKIVTAPQITHQKAGMYIFIHAD